MRSRPGACIFALAALAATFAFAAPAQAAFPGKNGKIAFVSARTGGPSDLDLFTMNPDGTGQTRITAAPLNDRYPAWSADGTRIAYESNQSQTGQEDIWVADADGTGALRLTSDPAVDTHPAWSPDGTRIAFTSERDGNREIYVMNADGTNQVNVTRSGATSDFHPAWSPDGTRIAFTSNRDDPCLTCFSNFELYTMSPDGSGVTRVTNTADREFEPAWSPDGLRFAAHVENQSQTASEIHVMNTDGSGRLNVTADGTIYQDSPAWSPDGTRIAFRQGEFGDAELWSMSPDGSDRTRLTANSFGDADPDWQPIPGPVRGDHQNSAQFCRAERAFLGDAAFSMKYGANGNDANAFGKCVSSN